MDIHELQDVLMLCCFSVHYIYAEDSIIAQSGSSQSQDWDSVVGHHRHQPWSHEICDIILFL